MSSQWLFKSPFCALPTSIFKHIYNLIAPSATEITIPVPIDINEYSHLISCSTERCPYEKLISMELILSINYVVYRLTGYRIEPS